MFLQETSDRHGGATERSRIARAGCDDGKDLGSPSATPSSEHASLVQRLRGGNQKEFEETVRTFGGRLLATARRYLPSEDDAQDALQDALLCAFRSIGKFNGDRQLSTWLHRIVINSALMHLRARRQRPDAAPIQIDELQSHFDQAANWMVESSHTMPAHVSFEIAETQAMVRRCIEELPAAHRLIVTLRDIDELDTEEVASLLGITSATVKVRLHRARQALKVIIERRAYFVTVSRATSLFGPTSIRRYNRPQHYAS